ncbi:hypothetical protein [Flavobacterium antarcticum]|nr:hypothetical protein [Flavobacterium antarcticum]
MLNLFQHLLVLACIFLIDLELISESAFWSGGSASSAELGN